ncbi:Cysteine dioxygenase type I [Carbonactinospora thermoautotrophica]|uniref:Cysteine dioxygenase type I n=2 Tax=Carbonactinospora thermoautotrophica TaxID=1469144 RepID=A0A132MHI2_9ACTN|nr:cysteine dioxygenase family protein [Carbonactinospora thermoautotrophica]KWW97253.1 Cysteine dioxygenase type I [Carbonactinospora thermoautotrophica]
MPIDTRTTVREFSLPGDLVPMAPSGLHTLTARTGPSVAWLARQASQIAARPQDWWHLVEFTRDRRWYRLLRREPESEVWLLSWLPGQRTGLHDHGGAFGVFALAVGALTERSFDQHADRRGGRLRELTVRTDQVRVFGPHHVHDLGNESAAPAVSVHVYSPALTEMRRYEWTGEDLIRTGVERVGVDW